MYPKILNTGETTNIDTKNTVRSEMQVKSSNYCKKVSRGVYLPEQKFIRDIVSGMVATGTMSVFNIEEAHSQMKSDLKIEKMRLASYTGFKNLNMLMWIALYFIYSVKKHIIKIAQAFPKLIRFKNKDWKRLFEFSYYRVAQFLTNCFTGVRF